jgi:hypothetical protein
MKYNEDELTRLSDYELNRHFLTIRSKINSHKRKKEINKNLEVYYCYIYRELEKRNNFQMKQSV